MRTRILPALALLPLVAACAQVSESRDEATDAAVAAETATEVVAVAAPAPTPPVAVTPAAPVSTSPRPPAAPPATVADLGAAPPPASEEAAAEEPAEEVAATPPAPAPGRLGTTVASLGSPTQGGLWLETALVDAPTTGRVEYNGQSVTLELRPSGGEPGSGSQISLEAMRALGAPLTGLPELVVFAG